MVASHTARIYSSVETACSGTCCYGSYSSEAQACRCSSLDTSCELPMYVLKLAGALYQVMQHNDANLHLVADKPTCFHCAQAPPISIRAYIQRIAKHSKCSPVCFIMAWSYLKCLAQSHAEMAVTSLTIHRLVITAVMLAAKLMDDKYYSNVFYAKIGGVTISELNQMELEMLRMLDYRTFVSSSRVHELLGRLEVFQAPGRIVSVLCRKRSSYSLKSSAAVSASYVDLYKPKLAKSNIAKQPVQQPSATSGRFASQTISDQRYCDSLQNATLEMTKTRCGPAVERGVVCEQPTEFIESQVVVDVVA